MNLVMDKSTSSSVSSRLLTDVPCKVCSDHSSGKHYGIYACDGCAGFFKRSVRRGRCYECKSRGQCCAVDKTHRNQCRACRLKKCVEAGMNKEAVQHERGPRHSTIRRQMAALCLKSSPAQITAATFAAAAAAHSCIAHASYRPHHLLPPRPLNFNDVTPTSLGLTPLPFSLLYSPGQMNSLTTQYTSSVTPSSPPCTTSLLNPTSSSVAPVPVSCSTVSELVREYAARFLFVAVRWPKSVPTFCQLPLNDQKLLLQDGWRELFLLTAAQFKMVFSYAASDNSTTPQTTTGLSNQSPSISTSSATDDSPTVTSSSFVREMRQLDDVIIKFNVLQVDPTEYAYIKAIVLFKTALSLDHGNLTDLSTISAIQDEAQSSLSRYDELTYPSQPFRFGKLLLLLPLLRSVSTRTIEELFFRSTIGDIPVSRIVADMFAAAGTGDTQ